MCDQRVSGRFAAKSFHCFMKLQLIRCEVCFISPHHELIYFLHNSLIPFIHVVELLERKNERN